MRHQFYRFLPQLSLAGLQRALHHNQWNHTTLSHCQFVYVKSAQSWTLIHA